MEIMGKRYSIVDVWKAQAFVAGMPKEVRAMRACLWLMHNAKAVA